MTTPTDDTTEVNQTPDSMDIGGAKVNIDNDAHRVSIDDGELRDIKQHLRFEVLVQFYVAMEHKRQEDVTLGYMQDASKIYGKAIDKVIKLLHQYGNTRAVEARIEGRIEAGVQLRKSMISTSTFVEEILNPYLTQQRQALKALYPTNNKENN